MMEKNLLILPGNFKIVLRLRDRHVFYVAINRFQYFGFEEDFPKKESPFKKLEYYFLVESTKIENETFPRKMALSEGNVKTSRMGITKWKEIAKNKVLLEATLFL